MSQYSPFSKEELMPQEEMLEIKRQKGELFIGLPKETHFEEKRVCLTPDAVAALTAHGHRIVVETGAGEAANFNDKEYADAGAKISYNTEEAFGCNIVLKVAPPTLKEIEYIKPQSILLSALQLKTQTKKYFETLAKKRITAVAFDYIKDEHGVYPIVKSLSEIAGTASVLIASELLSNSNQGNGLLFGNIGGVPPTDVVIIGAGTVGEFAARSALGLGARVKVFDNSITKLRNLQHCLNTPIYTSTIQPKTLLKALMRCDVVIGALRGKNRTPIIVTEAMVEQMKDGALIVDVSIDRGGCFETSKATTHQDPVYIIEDVVHYCVANMPGGVARTSTMALNNATLPFGLALANKGPAKAMLEDKHLLNGLNVHEGKVTYKAVVDALGEKLGLTYTPAQEALNA